MSGLLKANLLGGSTVGWPVVVGLIFLEVAEWDPRLDMCISYHPAIQIHHTLSRTQGTTYHPRCLFMARSSLAGGEICYFMRNFVLMVC